VEEVKPLELEEEIEDETSSDEEPLVLTEEIPSNGFRKNNLSNILSPSVRKIVAENKIDLKSIKGSGKDGQVLKGDLLNLMSKSPKPSERKIKFGQEERIKMSRLRQTIAKRLKQAQENAALLTTFNEVDMSNIIKMRKEYQDDFAKKYSVKLGFMSFFVKASIEALKIFPAVNAEIDGEDIVYKNYYNISFAVATDKGLVVPVLKNAENMDFPEIEKTIVNFGKQAREGNLTIQDMSNGTFTISNGGVYGSMLSSPILNPPQSGILGMHNIQKRAVVIDDKVEIRSMMYLALSYDHRIIDGREAVSFLVNVKENLEDPQRMLIGV
jgi:2-oxoglutarate dehydrogenase E2 component (dihydrolipoamide succinyltransferase)